jgi:hypothetical protein
MKRSDSISKGFPIRQVQEEIYPDKVGLKAPLDKTRSKSCVDSKEDFIQKKTAYISHGIYLIVI